MTSLFEVRTKSLTKEELQQRLEEFIKAGRNVRTALDNAIKPRAISEATSASETDPVEAAFLPRLAMFELEIFGYSLEKSTLRERVIQTEIKFNQVFRLFHAKRKDFAKAIQIKAMLKEKLENYLREVATLEFG